MKRVLYRPAAAADVEDGFNWYEQQREGLGAKFLEEVNAATIRLQRSPAAYPIRFRETRAAPLPRFPYTLYYRIADDQVVVVGCIHGRRSPRIWRSRG